MRNKSIVFLVTAFICLTSGILLPCKVSEVLTPEQLIVQATSIVVAVPMEYEKKPKSPDEFGSIRFDIKTVLKGEPSMKQVTIEGVLTDKDDFNEGTVPYSSVRPSGKQGSCYAYSYKDGASYLLFLNEQKGSDEHKMKEPSPYWAPLSPVNEQLKSMDDPWLQWVENAINKK
jgi:hypothetical protein